MQLIRTLDSYKSPKGAVATIGNFDGVHLGHQMVIKKIIAKSKALKLPTMVIAFEPSAKEFFLKQDAPARLTNFREKFSLISELGIDKLVCLSFNRSLANMPAEDFIKNILVTRLAIQSLTVGDNFRFGKNRLGDFELLQNFSTTLGYHVENSDSYMHNNQRVSSSLIRKVLSNGDLHQAEVLLGRPYSISGRVVHGDKKGRTIGFPTANIPIKRIQSALSGVFAVEVLMENGDKQIGVANIGKRPTVSGTKTQLEVHLFNFTREIYGEYLIVTFRKKLREEIKFLSFEELKNQILKDSLQAQSYFNETTQ